MADSIRRMLHDLRASGSTEGAGVKDEAGPPPQGEGEIGAVHMKAEALAHLAMSVVFISAYREAVAQERKTGAALRPLLNQLSLDVAKAAAALEGVERMSGLVDDGSV